MRWLLSAALTVCCTGTALADSQFWVAIGSYRDVAYAQSALARANTVLGESLTLTPVDIEAVRWYRVVRGPYASRGVAESAIDGARQAGFDSAWLLIVDSAEMATESTSADYDEYRVDDEYGNYDDYGSYEGYESYADDYGELPSYESSAPGTGDGGEGRAKSQPKLVDEAPEDYGLHKLRRDGE